MYGFNIWIKKAIENALNTIPNVLQLLVFNLS